MIVLLTPTIPNFTNCRKAETVSSVSCFPVTLYTRCNTKKTIRLIQSHTPLPICCILSCLFRICCMFSCNRYLSAACSTMNAAGTQAYIPRSNTYHNIKISAGQVSISAQSFWIMIFYYLLIYLSPT